MEDVIVKVQLRDSTTRNLREFNIRISQSGISINDFITGNDVYVGLYLGRVETVVYESEKDEPVVIHRWD